MTRTQILMEACKIVNGDRDKQYDTPENNFALIADLWSAYLGQRVTARDVALMMALLKVARAKTGHYTEDSYIDGCGYMALAGEMGAR